MIILIFIRAGDNNLNKVAVSDLRTLWSLVKSLDNSEEVLAWNIPEAVAQGGVKKVYGWDDRPETLKRYNPTLTEAPYNSFLIKEKS